MLCGSIFLLIVGAGGHSFDSRMNRVESSTRVTGAAGLTRYTANSKVDSRTVADDREPK